MAEEQKAEGQEEAKKADGQKDESAKGTEPFDYQSECHCSKTAMKYFDDRYGFDYQSECHCSKTSLSVLPFQAEV